MELEKIKLNDGSYMPKMGQGTWRMGEDSKKEEEEVNSIYNGILMGMNMIDTAEMYGYGNAEIIVGKALKKAMENGQVSREDIYIVSKVLPHNAGKKRIFKSCENTLKRLGVDYLDMYLLHWRGSVPLIETVQCLEKLKKDKKILNWGVSNFDVDDMEELLSLPDGNQCRINQVLYNLGSRGIEYSLIPYQNEYGIPIMAYTPVNMSSRLIERNKGIKNLSEKYNVSKYQILLAFVMNNPSVIAIPKSTKIEHLKENFDVYKKKIILTQEDIKELNKYFPPPNEKMPLDVA